jgi:hypothetical protein
MPANYVLLERIELNASASSVVFNNIPQSGYTDLKLELSVRQTNASAFSTMQLQINGSTANFTNRILEADTAGSPGSSTSPARYVGYLNASTSTANTFASASIYFPNYLASTNKSYSIDYTSEANATSSWLGFVAGLWSSTTAISSISLVPSTGSIAANSTFSLYGLAALGTEPVIAPKATGGNLIENDGTYWIHTFYSTGTFTPLQGLSCDYLVVAGGAGGGNHAAGGGGAGGLRSTVTATGGGGSLESALSVASGTAYTIQVGAGGAGLASQGASSSSAGNNGTNSVFSTITSTGGGGGGAIGATTGKTGGSGGGGGGATTASGGAGTANQGYAGGSATASQGGGGGGAGAAGGTANGGNGVAVSITGTSTTYAGGGGGAGSSSAGTGGSGGGGNGGTNNATNNTAGTANTGGGGGGQWYSPSGAGPYGAGGSGIVIIRYPIA